MELAIVVETSDMDIGTIVSFKQRTEAPTFLLNKLFPKVGKPSPWFLIFTNQTFTGSVMKDGPEGPKNGTTTSVTFMKNALLFMFWKPLLLVPPGRAEKPLSFVALSFGACQMEVPVVLNFSPATLIPPKFE